MKFEEAGRAVDREVAKLTDLLDKKLKPATREDMAALLRRASATLPRWRGALIRRMSLDPVAHSPARIPARASLRRTLRMVALAGVILVSSGCLHRHHHVQATGRTPVPVPGSSAGRTPRSRRTRDRLLERTPLQRQADRQRRNL